MISNFMKWVLILLLSNLLTACAIVQRSYDPVNRTIHIEKPSRVLLDLAKFEKEQIKNKKEGQFYFSEKSISEFKKIFADTVRANLLVVTDENQADYILAFQYNEQINPSCCDGFLSAVTLFIVPEIGTIAHTMTADLRMRQSEISIAKFQSTSKGTVIIHLIAIPFFWTSFLLPSYNDDFLIFAQDIGEQTLLYFEYHQKY